MRKWLASDLSALDLLAGRSGEARIFLIQDDNLTAEVPLRRSILQSTLRQKYRSTGRHNPQRDGGPEKGLYRLHPIALSQAPPSGQSGPLRSYYTRLSLVSGLRLTPCPVPDDRTRQLPQDGGGWP